MFGRFPEYNNKEHPPTSMFTTTEITTDDILSLLEQQLDNHTALITFVRQNNLTPATTLIPQLLKQFDATLSHNEQLLIDCLNLLDTMSLYSLTTYGNSETFFDEMVKLISKNRSLDQQGSTLGKDTLDDYIFTSQEDAIHFLNANRMIVSVYVTALLEMLFYRGKE